MAKVTNAFTTYKATGNREDLSNAIYNIDPFDTPVMSDIRRRNVKNRIFDWQTENLPTVAPAYPTAGYNAQFEGFQLSNALSPSRPSGKTTSRRSPSATPPCREPRKRPTPPARARKWRTRWRSPPRCSSPTWKRRSAPASRASTATTPGRPLASPKASPTGSGGSQPPEPARRPEQAAQSPASSPACRPSATRLAFAAVAGGSQIQVSEAMLGQAMQNAYTNGASPSLWVVPPGPKRTISTFVGRSTTQVLVGKNEVVSTIDVIATDFGRIKVAPVDGCRQMSGC